MKEAIFNRDLQYERCAIVFDFYMKIKQHLTRNDKEEVTNKLLEYKLTQDARVVQYTTYHYRRTYIGLGTENIDEHNTLKEYNEHIVSPNRHDKSYMNVVSETINTSK